MQGSMQIGTGSLSASRRASEGSERVGARLGGNVKSPNCSILLKRIAKGTSVLLGPSPRKLVAAKSCVNTGCRTSPSCNPGPSQTHGATLGCREAPDSEQFNDRLRRRELQTEGPAIVAVNVDLSNFAALPAYLQRVNARPAVREAMQAEGVKVST